MTNMDRMICTNHISSLGYSRAILFENGTLKKIWEQNNNSYFVIILSFTTATILTNFLSKDYINRHMLDIWKRILHKWGYVLTTVSDNECI
jgi:hypothetical protein